MDSIFCFTLKKSQIYEKYSSILLHHFSKASWGLSILWIKMRVVYWYSIKFILSMKIVSPPAYFLRQAFYPAKTNLSGFVNRLIRLLTVKKKYRVTWKDYEKNWKFGGKKMWEGIMCPKKSEDFYCIVLVWENKRN